MDEGSYGLFLSDWFSENNSPPRPLSDALQNLPTIENQSRAPTTQSHFYLTFLPQTEILCAKEDIAQSESPLGPPSIRSSLSNLHPTVEAVSASIRIRPGRFTNILIAIAAVLILLSFGGSFARYGLGHDHVYGLLDPMETLFNVNREQNIPTLFSVALILTAVCLLALISVFKRQRRDPDTLRWMLLTGGFSCLAVDEGWSFHEMLTGPMQVLLGDKNLGMFYFTWVIPAIAGVALLGILFLGFLLRLPPSTRLTFIKAGCLYLGGAIGVEMLGGRFAELHGYQNLTYEIFAHLEESLEMAGIILFVHSLLWYLAEQFPEIRLVIHQEQAKGGYAAPESREEAAT